MTPFFPNRALQGQDPSAKAFRLPFQNLDSSNHALGQRTETLPETVSGGAIVSA